jgi:hypothetical protein
MRLANVAPSPPRTGKRAQAEADATVIYLQSQYAKKAYDTYIAELSKLGEMYAGLTRNAYKPVEQAAAKAGSPNRRSA